MTKNQDNKAESTALVVAGYGRRGKIHTSEGDYPFLCKGRRIRPVCGDIVTWTKNEQEKDAVVDAVNPRQNELQRSGHRGKPEVLAANVDMIFIIIATQPKYDPFLIDRYLAAAGNMDCEAVIVLNKCDLSNGENILGEYSALGYRTLKASAKSGTGVDAIEELLHNKSGLLVGQSGVGKSSLINALVPDADAAVAEISEASLEGKHTTTASMMHPLKQGDGWLIDSPGVRDFLPYIGDTRSVQAGFIEIARAAEQCRFANCQHLREPGCAVKEQVESGDISQHRYDSYKRLYHMTDDAKLKP